MTLRDPNGLALDVMIPELHEPRDTPGDRNPG